jgi:hypothetical protein
MAEDVRVYRNKVWLSGEAKDKVSYVADQSGVEPDEAFRRLFDRGYSLWLAERRRSKRPKRTPRSS